VLQIAATLALHVHKRLVKSHLGPQTSSETSTFWSKVLNDLHKTTIHFQQFSNTVVFTMKTKPVRLPAWLPGCLPGCWLAAWRLPACGTSALGFLKFMGAHFINKKRWSMKSFLLSAVQSCGGVLSQGLDTCRAHRLTGLAQLSGPSELTKLAHQNS